MGELASIQMEKTLRRLTESIKVLEEEARGISPEEYKAFLFIAGRPDAAVKDVQEHLGAPAASTSRMVHKLSSLHPGGYGLIDAATAPTNRRRTKLNLTAHGLKLLGRLAVITGSLMACSMDDLTKDPPRSLARNYYMGAITNAVDDRRHNGGPIRIRMLDPDTI